MSKDGEPEPAVSEVPPCPIHDVVPTWHRMLSAPRGLNGDPLLVFGCGLCFAYLPLCQNDRAWTEGYWRMHVDALNEWKSSGKK